jgi:hypothetical protein
MKLEYRADEDYCQISSVLLSHWLVDFLFYFDHVSLVHHKLRLKLHLHTTMLIL